jgi:hypothetical protein
VLVVFKTHKLEEKQQQKCLGKWICFGRIMEHFPRKRKKLLFDSILRADYELDASSLDIT